MHSVNFSQRRWGVCSGPGWITTSLMLKVHFDSCVTLLEKFSQQLGGMGDCGPCTLLSAGCRQCTRQKYFLAEEQQSPREKWHYSCCVVRKRCGRPTYSSANFGATPRCIFYCSSGVFPKTLLGLPRSLSPLQHAPGNQSTSLTFGSCHNPSEFVSLVPSKDRHEWPFYF